MDLVFSFGIQKFSLATLIIPLEPCRFTILLPMIMNLVCMVKLFPCPWKCLQARMELGFFVSFLWLFNLTLNVVWLYVIIMSRTSFRVNPHSIGCLNVKELLAPSSPYLKFKWQQRDSNLQPLCMSMNTQAFSQTGQMIELSWYYLPVRCIWVLPVKCNVQISSHNTARSFSQVG